MDRLKKEQVFEAEKTKLEKKDKKAKKVNNYG